MTRRLPTACQNTSRSAPLRKGVVLALGAQISIQLVGLLTGVMVARYLGPGGRGELAAVVAWSSLVPYIGNLGLPTAFTYATASGKSRLGEILARALCSLAIQIPLLIALGLPALHAGLADYSAETQHLASFYLICYIPLNLATLYGAAMLQGLGSHRAFNTVRLSVPLAYASGLVILAASNAFNVSNVLRMSLTANLVALITCCVLVLSAIHSHSAPLLQSFHLATLLSDLRYGLSAHIGTLQPFTSLQLDILILTQVASPEDLGLYSAALAGSVIIRAQGFAIGTVALPALARETALGARISLLRRLTRLTLITASASLLVMLVWARPLLRLVYGDAFEGAASLLRLLAVAGVLIALQRVLADGLRGLGSPGGASLPEVAALLFGVPAILTLAASYGASGAAAGVVAGAAAALCTTAGIFHRARNRSGYRVRADHPQ